MRLDGVTKMSMPQVKIENGTVFLTVELPLLEDPRISGSGKSILIADTNGFMGTELRHKVEGLEKQVLIQVHVCVNR